MPSKLTNANYKDFAKAVTQKGFDTSWWKDALGELKLIGPIAPIIKKLSALKVAKNGNLNNVADKDLPAVSDVAGKLAAAAGKFKASVQLMAVMKPFGAKAAEVKTVAEAIMRQKVEARDRAYAKEKATFFKKTMQLLGSDALLQACYKRISELHRSIRAAERARNAYTQVSDDPADPALKIALDSYMITRTVKADMGNAIGQKVSRLLKVTETHLKEDNWAVIDAYQGNVVTKKKLTAARDALVKELNGLVATENTLLKELKGHLKHCHPDLQKAVGA